MNADMATAPFRENMKSGILAVFQPLDWVSAMWEGGSAATGNLDDYSDLDLAVIVEDDRVEEAFGLFEEYLESEYRILHMFRLPEPCWHGHSQCFYFIDNAPPLYYIDFLVEKRSAEERLLEKDRHGEARVWFDRHGLAAGTVSDPRQLKRRRTDFLEMTRSVLPLMAVEVRKQIARGKKIDAVSQYQRFIAARLAGLLNLKYRPARFDFGIRYAERAYPADVNRRLERLLYPENFDELPVLFEEAVRWSEELIEEMAEAE